jgi:hypothetical protein
MKITHVQLTQALFVPKLGAKGFTLKRTLSEDPQAYPGISFKEREIGIHCTFKNEEFLIPWHMVECVAYVKESI